MCMCAVMRVSNLYDEDDDAEELEDAAVAVAVAVALVTVVVVHVICSHVKTESCVFKVPVLIALTTSLIFFTNLVVGFNILNTWTTLSRLRIDAS